MAKVYGLFSDELCLYVGSTILALEVREYIHRSKGNSCGSKNIPVDCEWDIRLLEECTSDMRRQREQFHYENLKPFYNQNNPYIGVSMKIYQNEYSKRTRDLKCAYRIKNSERDKECNRMRYIFNLSPEAKLKYAKKKEVQKRMKEFYASRVNV